MSHNKNYFKEIKDQKPLILKDRNCPKCKSKLGAIYPDKVWCINEQCNYGEMHLIGQGVRELEFETSNLNRK